MPADAYEKKMQQLAAEYEARCRRCGDCCGRDNDPCVHLREHPDGTFFCEVYEDRLRQQQTRSGKHFRCVPIRQLLEKGWPGTGRCGYIR